MILRYIQAANLNFTTNSHVVKYKVSLFYFVMYKKKCYKITTIYLKFQHRLFVWDIFRKEGLVFRPRLLVGFFKTGDHNYSFRTWYFSQ